VAPPPKTPAAETAALIERAEGHERARRYDLARAAYSEAVEKAPDPRSGAHAAHRFGSALAFWGELEAGVSMLERAVSLDSKRASAWHDLGIVRANSGDLVAGEVALRKARELAAKDPRPRVALAALLVKTRRFTEAQSEYRALLELELPEKTRSAILRALELLASEG